MNDRINKLQLFLKNLNSSQYYARHILLKRQLILSTYDDNLHFYYYKFCQKKYFLITNLRKNNFVTN
jgi:hypothetical protein